MCVVHAPLHSTALIFIFKSDFLVTEPIVQSFSVSSSENCTIRLPIDVFGCRYGVASLGVWFIAYWSAWSAYNSGTYRLIGLQSNNSYVSNDLWFQCSTGWLCIYNIEVS